MKSDLWLECCNPFQSPADAFNRAMSNPLLRLDDFRSQYLQQPVLPPEGYKMDPKTGELVENPSK